MKKSQVSSRKSPVTLFAKSKKGAVAREIESTTRSVPFLALSAKKGIGPVVAIALLIVVAVSSVIGFQTWFGAFQSNIQTKSETSSSNYITIDLNYAENSGTSMKIYYSNPSSIYIPVNEIKINSIVCTIIGSDTLVENSITEIEVTGCSVSSRENAKIVLITPKGIYEEEVYIK